MMTNEAAIQELFKDQEFVQGLFELETPEEVQAALRGRDIEISLEEIYQVREILLKKMEGGAELSEEDLADVTGGFVVASTGVIILCAVLTGTVTALATGGGGVLAILVTQMATGGKW